MISMAKKPALGKGLSALLSDTDTDVTSNSIGDSNADIVGSISSLAVAQIEANPFQPRTEFEEERLQELSASIKELGVIQPITVRKMGNDKFQIISGERRFRATQLAGLDRIPAFIRIANDQEMLEMALVENIQREDLNAIEIGLSYERLMNECNLTQDELSERVGKNRSTIANYIRLLNLPAEIQKGIQEKKLSMGHARALLSVEDEEEQIAIYRSILESDVSVREVEGLTRKIKNVTGNKSTKEKPQLSFTELKLKSDLSELFQTKVDLQKSNKGKGKIVIPYKSKEDLERIANLLRD